LPAKDTLDRLVVQHLPAAMRFAVRLTGRTDTAEDLLQDALVRVARAGDTYRGEASFRTWLFRILINVFRDRLKKRSEESLAADEHAARSPSPPQAAMAAELGSRIAELVSSLPPRQREVLVLTVYENLPAAEVAEIVGISETNVRSTLYAARCRLRQQLGAYLDM
jgi:RNA polymerase sigma-70 factor (ECF subfamily)